MFLVTSRIVINMPTRTELAVETITSFVPWLANLNIKRNVTSMFVNKNIDILICFQISILIYAF